MYARHKDSLFAGKINGHGMKTSASFVCFISEQMEVVPQHAGHTVRQLPSLSCIGIANWKPHQKRGRMRTHTRAFLDRIFLKILFARSARAGLFFSIALILLSASSTLIIWEECSPFFIVCRTVDIAAEVE
jgi:hypothetical protein